MEDKHGSRIDRTDNSIFFDRHGSTDRAREETSFDVGNDDWLDVDDCWGRELQRHGRVWRSA